MMKQMKFNNILVCPFCKSKLKQDKKLSCLSCKKKYSYIRGKPAFVKPSKHSKDKILDFFIKHVKWMIPSPSYNFLVKKHMMFFKKNMSKISDPKILIIGGGQSKYAKGINILSRYEKNIINLELVDGPIVDVIGDAHNLPFKNNSFDLVIIQAVLEHVANPIKVVDEIYRVLKKPGRVYAGIPFIQGIHARPHDFQRYTNYGLDILFEKFKKIESDILLGPTGSLIWVLREYLSILFSFNNKYLYYFFNFLFGWVFLPLKYLDYILIRLKYSANIAGGYFYIGKK